MTDFAKRVGRVGTGGVLHIVNDSESGPQSYGSYYAHCTQWLSSGTIRKIIEGETLCKNCLARVRKLREMEGEVQPESSDDPLEFYPDGMEVTKMLEVRIYLQEDCEGGAIEALAGRMRAYADWLDECEDDITSVVVSLD